MYFHTEGVKVSTVTGAALMGNGQNARKAHLFLFPLAEHDHGPYYFEERYNTLRCRLALIHYHQPDP